MIEAVLHGTGAYRKGAAIGPVCWPHHDLIVVTRGSANFSIGGAMVLCEADSCVFIPPGHRVAGEAGSGGCEIWVQHFRILRWRSFRPALSLPRRPEIWTGAAGKVWARALMQRAGALQRNDSAGRRLLPHVLLLLLHALREEVSGFGSGADAGAQKIRKAMDFAIARRCSPPTVGQMAEHTGWSASYFRAAFRRHNVCGAGTWLRELRIEEAKRFLRETNLPVKEIGPRVGYSDHVSFHRAFTRHTGTTPARFRADLPRIA